MAGNFNFQDVEREVRDFWDDNKVYDKRKQKNQSGPKFFFMDGPPYTSSDKIHIGTAWNKLLKDCVLRYRRMNGYNVFDRACYDMHGLPTSRKVMANLDLHNDGDVEKYGVENFAKACKELCVTNAEGMTKEFQNMGVWLDFSDPLYPIHTDFIEGCWNLVKKANEAGRLYKGKRPIAWSPAAETALAKHELVYKEIKDRSIFVKFKIKGTENEYFVIWTTTPWTIPYNLAIMAHPDFDYVKADINGEKWIMAKELATGLIEVNLKETLVISQELKGKDLEGLEYIHPLLDVVPALKDIKENNKSCHTVLMTNQYVDLSAGTGLVHCAPGCGPEDYEVGHKNGLPPFNEVDERGYFKESMGELKGKVAKTDDRFFIELLDKHNALVFDKSYKHDYPHCERTKKPIIYRTTDQWFFQVEDMKEEMIGENNGVRWNPGTGFNSFNSWLENLRDNSITRQKFWGTPVPIWKCDGSDYFEVIGSVDELKSKGVEVPDDLHRPYIDNVTWPSPDGKGTMRRIPDVVDVWIDAGMLPFNVVNYHKDQTKFNELFPGDYIVEGTDQIRGWFNVLLVCSKLMGHKIPFKNVYMHGMITSVDGEKMSKSLGNMISPDELFDKYGIDSSRAYLAQTPPGPDKKFSWEELALIHRDFNVIWNTQNFLLELIKLNNMQLQGIELNQLSLEKEEEYILSKLHSTIKEVTSNFEEYRVNETIKPVTDLLLELSRNYIKFVRDKASSGSDNEKLTVAWTINQVIYSSMKLLAPNCPFITEKIYHNLKDINGSQVESVHLFDWPEVNEDLIRPELESGIEIAEDVIQSILSLRKKTNRGVKWPYGTVMMTLHDSKLKDNVLTWKDLIESQTNIKSLEIIEKFENLNANFEVNMKSIGPKFGKDSRAVVTHLMEMDQQKVLDELNSNGKVIVKLESDYELVQDDFKIHYEVKEPYVKADISLASIYLDTTVTQDLDNEGFGREIVRAIQQLRKDSGFVKSDKVNLKVEMNLSEAVKQVVEENKEKLGYDQISYEANSGKEFEIKDEKVKIEISGSN